MLIACRKAFFVGPRIPLNHLSSSFYNGKTSNEGAKGMRKILLGVFCVGSGVVMAVLFGAVVLWQSLGYTIHPQASEMDFPMAVPETSLSVLQLNSYEGPYLESEEPKETVKSAAVLVENKGGLYVSQGAVVLEQAGKQLVFEIKDLPAGQRVLVLEKDAQAVDNFHGWTCYGWCREEYPEQQSWIEIKQISQGLAVTNVTDHTLQVVHLTLKRQASQGNTLIGGISLQRELQNLKPGETRFLSIPQNWIGQVRVVRTLVYAK